MNRSVEAYNYFYDKLQKVAHMRFSYFEKSKEIWKSAVRVNENDEISRNHDLLLLEEQHQRGDHIRNMGSYGIDVDVNVEQHV